MANPNRASYKFTTPVDFLSDKGNASVADQIENRQFFITETQDDYCKDGGSPFSKLNSTNRSSNGFKKAVE